MNNYSWRVFYVNSNGQDVCKLFQNETEARSFCFGLSQRIVGGTCGGYILIKI